MGEHPLLEAFLFIFMLDFETSFRLKNAGFKQPTSLEVGQVWYVDSEAVMIIDPEFSTTTVKIWDIQNRNSATIWNRAFKNAEYAPASHEIILPECVFCQNHISTRIFAGWREFEDARVLVEHASEVKAKAEAWLLLFSV